jgi:hypothetical protein
MILPPLKFSSFVSVSFTGEFSRNLGLKNMISSYTKYFSRKKAPNSPDFEGKKLHIARCS